MGDNVTVQWSLEGVNRNQPLIIKSTLGRNVVIFQGGSGSTQQQQFIPMGDRKTTFGFRLINAQESHTGRYIVVQGTATDLYNTSVSLSVVPVFVISVTSSPGLLRVEEGDNVTVMWTLEGVRGGYPLKIISPQGTEVVSYEFGLSSAIEPYIPVGDGKSTTGFTLDNVQLSHAGIYRVEQEKTITPDMESAMIFVFGEIILPSDHLL